MAEGESRRHLREVGRLKQAELRLAAFWLSQPLIGTNVVQTASGTTGVVHKVLPWGVQVWSPLRGNERENWSWNMIAQRIPRTRIRHPRPLRWPRVKPTAQCHCRSGKMAVVKGTTNNVRCEICRRLIGNESFKNRIARAEKLIREKSPLEIIADSIKTGKGALRKARKAAKALKEKEAPASSPVVVDEMDSPAANIALDEIEAPQQTETQNHLDEENPTVHTSTEPGGPTTAIPPEGYTFVPATKTDKAED